MRLIDDDRLRNELKTLPVMSNWGEVFIPSLIDDQPTAYDVDKVVEQLEEEKRNPNLYVYAVDAYYKAIEIVKGGVE